MKVREAKLLHLSPTQSWCSILNSFIFVTLQFHLRQKPAWDKLTENNNNHGHFQIRLPTIVIQLLNLFLQWKTKFLYIEPFFSF